MKPRTGKQDPLPLLLAKENPLLGVIADRRAKTNLQSKEGSEEHLEKQH